MVKKHIIVFILILGLILFPCSSERIVSDNRQELIHLREAYSKTYLLPDGTYQYVAYAEDIHYYKNGEYEEIDNSIVDSELPGYSFTNRSNSWHVYFKDTIASHDSIMIINNEHAVSFSNPDADHSVIKKATSLIKGDNWFYDEISEDNRAVIYQEIYEDVDLVYTVLSNTLKEAMVLKSPTDREFCITVCSPELSLTTDIDGTIYFVSETGEIIFQIQQMYMIDGEGKRSDNVSFEITKTEEGNTISIIPDHDFLYDPDTVYPVVIDPSTTITGSSNTYDTCVDEQYPNSNYYLAESLWTGGKTGTNTMRTYVKFNLPTNILAQNVTNVYLRIKKREHKAPTIKAYRVIGSWTSSTVTWNNKPSFSTSGATGTITLDSGSWYKINCTDMVKNWLNGNYTNNGFLLKEPNETDSSQKTKYYSSDAPSPNKPELVINYTSSGGGNSNPTFVMKHYTDEGYRVRYANLSYSIGSFQSVVKNKLESFFDINITSNIYQTYMSYGDTCKQSLPGQFADNLNVSCGHSPDHLLRANIKNKFVEDKGSGSTTVAKYLWTGHILTGNARSATYTNQKVVVMTTYGTLTSSYGNLSDIAIKKTRLYTLMHETSHLLSAHDQYCYEDNGTNNCSNPYCVKCQQLAITNNLCIMYKRIDNIESINDVDDMYCSICKDNIISYINSLS
ncbi:MAG: DNRLRE domain-containing protein [Clostridia bacterium]|nr:DNRLRE domain-containing protein [Clostridia bacterium]